MKKIAIIGAGPCGIMSAILLAKNKDINITLFEQNDKIGKKLLISGNGKCNITNKNISLDNYQGNNKECIENALKELSFEKLKKHLEQLGLFIHSKENAQSYPLSNSGSSVVNIFLNALTQKNINIECNTKITDIKQEKTFTLISENKQHKSFDIVILTSGSQAYPILGGNDSGYNIAQKLEHTITRTTPSLVGLEANIPHLKLLSGLKQKANIKLYTQDKLVKEFTNDVLFTKYGVSGFGIFDISQYINLKYQNELKINFFPDIPKSQFINMLENIIKINSKSMFEHTLSGIVHKKFIHYIFKKLNIYKETTNEKITAKLIQEITNSLYEFTIHIINTHGYKHSEVSNGGINSNEINPKTFQSNKIKNLYIGGEVLDIVGQRGGYNIHFAFASAFLISKDIISNT